MLSEVLRSSKQGAISSFRHLSPPQVLWHSYCVLFFSKRTEAKSPIFRFPSLRLFPCRISRPNSASFFSIRFEFRSEGRPPIVPLVSFFDEAEFRSPSLTSLISPHRIIEDPSPPIFKSPFPYRCPDNPALALQSYAVPLGFSMPPVSVASTDAQNFLVLVTRHYFFSLVRTLLKGSS